MSAETHLVIDGTMIHASQSGLELFEERPDTYRAFIETINTIAESPSGEVAAKNLPQPAIGRSTIYTPGDGTVNRLEDYPDLCTKFMSFNMPFTSKIASRLTPLPSDLRTDMNYMEALRIATAQSRVYVPAHYAVAHVRSPRLVGSVMLMDRLDSDILVDLKTHRSTGKFKQNSVVSTDDVMPILHSALTEEKLLRRSMGDILIWDEKFGSKQLHVHNILLERDKPVDESDIWIIDAIGGSIRHRLLARAAARRYFSE